MSDQETPSDFNTASAEGDMDGSERQGLQSDLFKGGDMNMMRASAGG